MENRLKAAFDSIKAEKKLKGNLLHYIQNEVQRRKKPLRYILAGRASGIAAAAFVAACLGAFSYNLYFTADTYVSLDINPSLELIINPFERIIDARAYNLEGEQILSKTSLKNKSYNKGLQILINKVEESGFLENMELVSVSLQTNDIKREQKLLSDIQTEIETLVSEHHKAPQIDIFPVSDDMRSRANELNISPAKYIAVLELMKIDPDVSFETCNGHSISELKKIAAGHGHGHQHGHQKTHGK